MNNYKNKFSIKADYARRCHTIVGKTDNDDQKENSYRNIFMTDRDRILYCKSFMRLAGKTQVYTPTTGDHQRTRLTHTLEVAQIARTISTGIGLNCDLTEAIALGHDIGHAPFGHAGERMLHEIMSPTNDLNSQTPKMTSIYKAAKNGVAEQYKNLYGYKHNLQSIRCVVEDLESKGMDYGLDLTNYTLWGIMNHSSIKYKKGFVATDCLEPYFYNKYMKFCEKESGSGAWSFEALVVAEADEIAQMHHDMEDSIRKHSMTHEKVIKLLNKLRPLMSTNDSLLLDSLSSQIRSKEFLIAAVSKIIVNTFVSVLIDNSLKNFKSLAEGKSTDEVFKLSHTDEEIRYTIGYDLNEEINKQNAKIVKDFKDELSSSVLYTYDVQRSDSKGKYIIKNLFEAYYTNPQQLPDSALRNLYKAFLENDVNFVKNKEYYLVEADELRKELFGVIRKAREEDYIEQDIILMRTICDYISGMTDSFAISEYEKLYG